MITLREWQLKTKPINDLIIQASSTDGQDRWQPFPIGMQFSYVYNYKKGDSIQIGQHDNTVLCAISSHTDQSRRPIGLNRQLFIHNLRNNDIVNNIINHNEYFETLPSYKFIISPEGNGIDCHRHYEALIAGCIPIIEYNDQIYEKYKDCPILYTKDYSEITEDYLIKKYNEMLDTRYDFSRLFLSFYDNDTQQYIKQCGNFWMNRCTNYVWYN
jgi:hypothetical protein